MGKSAVKGLEIYEKKGTISERNPLSVIARAI